MSKVAVVVPTIPQRAAIYEQFLSIWHMTFAKHDIMLIQVLDGDEPTVTVDIGAGTPQPAHVVMGEDYDLLYNHNDGVRNAGFYYIAKHLPHIETIITLDDDVLPVGDPIQDHLDALDMRVPVSWLSTASEFMRGFPYGVRGEAEVVLSHGVWEGVKDWDAPTQLVNGNRDVNFYRGPIPKGIHYPMCGMNLAFKRKLLPWMYFAPMGPRVGMDRFADIWCGICSKRVIDARGWAVVSGYATVLHERASNVWSNLQKEARGLAYNETFWAGTSDDAYFVEYQALRARWEMAIQQWT
jgi:reversibly glycosylated polypeptide/UDP-arabinopyranose mutase